MTTKSWDYGPAKSEMRGAKMTVAEATKVNVVCERIAAGTMRTKDSKHLRGEICEVRVQGNRRIFRLLYAYDNDTAVLLGLVFLNKKTNKTRGQLIDLAKQRLTTYRLGNP